MVFSSIDLTTSRSGDSVPDAVLSACAAGDGIVAMPCCEVTDTIEARGGPLKPVARAATFLGGLGFTSVSFLDFCDLVYACGCKAA